MSNHFTGLSLGPPLGDQRDVIDYRLAFLTKGECPPSGLSPHTDTLTGFPYLGRPHPAN